MKFFRLLQQMWMLCRERRRLFLVPVVALLLILGTVILLAEGSVIAPFIYTLF